MAKPSAPKASCPHPSLCPRLPPLGPSHKATCCCPEPRAVSQTAARVRSNSPEQRLAEKPPSPPADPRGRYGAAQSQLPFVFSLSSEPPKQTLDGFPSPSLGSCAVASSSRPGDADAFRCPRRETQSIPAVNERHPQVARGDAFEGSPGLRRGTSPSTAAGALRPRASSSSPPRPQDPGAPVLYRARGEPRGGGG